MATSGCGGTKSVIIPSGIVIRGSEFAGFHKPIDGVDDTTIVTGTISGNSASGGVTSLLWHDTLFSSPGVLIRAGLGEW